MYTLFRLAFSVALCQLLLPTWGVPLASSKASDHPVRLLWQFGKGSWAENLAVRSNGNLLVTRNDVPELYEIDPRSSNPTANLVHRFDEKLGLMGIAETSPDTFAVLGGIFSLATGFQFGSFSLYTVSFQHNGTHGGKGCSSSNSSSPIVAKVGDIPEADFLDGMVRLNDRLVLASDFYAGNIYRIDVFTGEHSVVSTDPLLAVAPYPDIGSVGVNGLRVHDNYLYFSNTGQRLLGRYPINMVDGTQLGAASVFARPLNSSFGYDDFAIREDGVLFVPTTGGNSVERLSADGKRGTIVAGNLNSTDIAQPTGAQLGRGLHDRDVLYLTTAGGLETPINGNIVVGAQVVAVKVGW